MAIFGQFLADFWQNRPKMVKMCLLSIIVFFIIESKHILAKMGARPETARSFSKLLAVSGIFGKNRHFWRFLAKTGYTYAGKFSAKICKKFCKSLRLSQKVRRCCTFWRPKILRKFLQNFCAAQKCQNGRAAAPNGFYKNFARARNHY